MHCLLKELLVAGSLLAEIERGESNAVAKYPPLIKV